LANIIYPLIDGLDQLVQVDIPHVGIGIGEVASHGHQHVIVAACGSLKQENIVLFYKAIMYK
jgi:hypothetical protein